MPRLWSEPDLEVRRTMRFIGLWILLLGAMGTWSSIWQQESTQTYTPKQLRAYCISPAVDLGKLPDRFNAWGNVVNVGLAKVIVIPVAECC